MAAALVTQAFAVGLTHGIYPVFLEPLEAAFDAPRTLVAGGQVLMMLSLTASSLATGLLFDRGHARRVMWGGAGLLASALVLAATASNLWILAGAAILMGLSVPSLGPLSGATLVTRSFAEERGRALGWIGMGPPLGAGAFAALAAYLIVRSDWRTTLLLFAGAVVLVLVPLIGFAVPARFEAPRDLGPSDGAPAVPDGSLGRPVFWLTAGMFALAAGIATGWTVHFVAFLGGQGLDEAQRAGLLSAQFWLAAPAAFVFGALGDRLRPERMLVGILAGQGVVLLLYSGTLVPAPLPHSLLFVLAIVSGLISGGLIPLFILLLGRRVAPAAFSRALGLANVLMLPALAASVLVSAYCFERQGSYQWALILLAAGQVAAIACLLASNRSVASP
ncbi:MAG: MFS transporter [Myxococcota bacterium]